ncbi:uncharacterized protein LOC110816390 [Carica papaya]|uniref:uncharacterized protein LOC110816390 n=1 Tax=Carica papaya TaxID=3649 RepID=UPI000B8C8D7C|nr:uncharacterized protein LOC110816390 [Carica papaya]
MGMIKMLNRLQIIPWCLHLIGSQNSCFQLPAAPPPATIKLIKSDGMVNIYDRPVYVSELMMEFPKHMVCRSGSFYIGQKIPALSEHDQLQFGQKYFLLPTHLFHSVLSFVTIASFTQSRNSLLKKTASCSKPFDIQKTPSGCLRIRVSDDFIWQLMQQGRITQEDDEMGGSSNGVVCTTAQLQKDYSQLVGSRQWKPKLETIREKGEKRKKLPAFRIKTKNKLRSSSDNQINRHGFCSKPKIRFRARK